MKLFKQTKSVLVSATTNEQGLHVVGWNEVKHQRGGQRVYNSKIAALISFFWIRISK